MRTGMGALPGNKSWQEYKYGFGPDPAGLFAQGNFGIVTKMGLRLMPQPEHWRTGAVTVPKRRDLVPLVETVNYLTDLAMIGEPWYGNAGAAAGNTEFLAAATAFNETELDRARGGGEPATAAGRAPVLRLRAHDACETGSMRRSSSRALVRNARLVDGESLPGCR